MKQSAGLRVCVILITLLLVLYVAWQMLIQAPELSASVPEDVFSYESADTATSEESPPEDGRAPEPFPAGAGTPEPSQSALTPVISSLPGAAGGESGMAVPEASAGEALLPPEEKASSEEEPPRTESSGNSGRPSPPADSSREDSSEPSPPASSETVSPPSDSTVSASSGPASSEDLSGLDAENDRAAGELEEKYAISIQLLREAGSWTDGGVAAYATDPHELKKGLAELSRALSDFPDGFFEGEMAFVLAGKLTSPGVLQTQEGVYLLPCRESFATVLSGMLVREAASGFSRECGLDFTDLNPAGFSYGEPEKRLVYSSSNPANGYFLSLAAQTDRETEMSEMLEAILAKGNTLLRIDPEAPLYRKISSCCLAALEWRPSLRQNRVVETFL